MSYEARSFSSRGLNLHLHTWGAPSDPPMLMVHGYMDTGRAFEAVVRALKQPRFVIAPDMRGHGGSDWIGPGGYYHFYDYFHDVRALVEHLAVEKLVVVGHSMGGSIACGVSAMLGAQVESLILLEGVGPPFHQPSDGLSRISLWSEALSRADLAGEPEARRAARKPMESVEVAARRMQRLNERLSEARALELAEVSTEPAGEGKEVVWRYDPLHRTPSPKLILLEEYASMWSAIQAPVLSLFGADSAAIWGDLEGRHARFSRLRAAYVPEAGHNIHHDRPELVAGAIEAWLEGEQLHTALLPF